MMRHNIPTARYKSITADNLQEGLDFLASLEAPYVLKADGLCAGKGVLILPHTGRSSERAEGNAGRHVRRCQRHGSH